MRVTIITQEHGADAPVKSTFDFAQDADALTEVWRLLTSEHGRGDLRDISWERADGVVVPHAALARWASLR